MNHSPIYPLVSFTNALSLSTIFTQIYMAPLIFFKHLHQHHHLVPLSSHPHPSTFADWKEWDLSQHGEGVQSTLSNRCRPHFSQSTSLTISHTPLVPPPHPMLIEYVGYWVTLITNFFPFTHLTIKSQTDTFISLNNNDDFAWNVLNKTLFQLCCVTRDAANRCLVHS